MMIYFDNAATTRIKPRQVYDAMNYYFEEIGVSPGRGSYSLGIKASRMLYNARTSLGSYFGMTHPDRVVFTKNSTEAINLLTHSVLNKGDHVLLTCYEHNAVLRPLHALKQEGIIDYTIISRDDLELDASDIYKKYVRDNTRLIMMTLASNLTGRIVYRNDWALFLHNKGILVGVDSSQGAGKIKIDMKNEGVDFVAFTAHKDLMGLPGVGGLCCESNERLRPLIQGGTGIKGDYFMNPDIFPEGYEAGTLNMPSIWALKTAIDYIQEHHEEIQEKETSLTQYLVSSLSKTEGITVYDYSFNRVPTCCFTIEGISTDKIVSLLDESGICVRGGIHCAIIAHQAIGTVNTGAVRVSLNHFNTKEEIDVLIQVLLNR